MTIPFHWDVRIVCRDCGTEFDVQSADPSTDVVNEHRTRIVLLKIPNDCPECHNLRLVKSDDAPEEPTA